MRGSKGEKPKPRDKDPKDSKPLAKIVRPVDLQDYISLEDIMGRDTVLKKALERQDIPSMIFWGPPGCAKTTSDSGARCCQVPTVRELQFVKCYLCHSGISVLEKVVVTAKTDLKYKKRT